MCHHVKFGSSGTKGVRIYRKETQNWGALGPRLLEWGVADHLKEDPSPYVSPVKFGSSASKGVCINRSDPPKLGALGLRPCNSGVADSLEIHPSCRIWSFYVKRYECYLGDPPEKCDPHVPPFKVIGSDTYDFLLTFHSNHGPIS